MATQKSGTLFSPFIVRLFAVAIFLFGAALGAFHIPQYTNVYLEKIAPFLQIPASFFPFRFGLDIRGGTHLVYQADLANIPTGEKSASMESLRDVIERRVNLFGVAEPVVQIERAGDQRRLIVELAGISDVSQAIRMIGETPFLEFKSERSAEEADAIIAASMKGEEVVLTADSFCGALDFQTLLLFMMQFGEDPCFVSTGLTGKHLASARVDFQGSGGIALNPSISLELTDEGAKIFSEITKENVGKRLAGYLDGAPISAPVVQEEITGGKAQITGNFTPEGAKALVGRFNAGALPVPITLISQQTVGPSLGKESLDRSLVAGLYGFLAVTIFMVLWYRIPGAIAVLALLFYVSLVLVVFRMIPVTLTVAGIAGFILSIGMAVDANVLIFERLKEELKNGKTLREGLEEGFRRAWSSIRDSNITSLITCAILYWFGSSIIQGFALTLAIGILASMLSAVWVTRLFLFSLAGTPVARVRTFFMSGFSKG